MSKSLTKDQIEGNERIDRWLSGQLSLSRLQVITSYTPPWYLQSYNAQFLTPLNVSNTMSAFVDWSKVKRVLEPSAGIGNLLFPFADRQDLYVEAWDLDEKSVQIGRRLYPFVKWVHGDFLDFEGSPSIFDLILMNPPYPDGLIGKFFRACIPLLKPGGTMIMLIPTHELRLIDERVRLDRSYGPYKINFKTCNNVVDIRIYERIDR